MSVNVEVCSAMFCVIHPELRTSELALVCLLSEHYRNAEALARTVAHWYLQIIINSEY